MLVSHPQGSPAASWPAATAADAPSHQRHFSVSFAVMNNYQAAAAAAQGFGPPASPHAANTRAGFPPANSPGPTIDMYSSSAADTVAGYVQATSPQPSGFPAIAVSRAPLNYSPVSKPQLRRVIQVSRLESSNHLSFFLSRRDHSSRQLSPTATTEVASSRSSVNCCCCGVHSSGNP